MLNHRAAQEGLAWPLGIQRAASYSWQAAWVLRTSVRWPADLGPWSPRPFQKPAGRLLANRNCLLLRGEAGQGWQVTQKAFPGVKLPCALHLAGLSVGDSGTCRFHFLETWIDLGAGEWRRVLAREIWAWPKSEM